jgi:hypothetical protein
MIELKLVTHVNEQRLRESYADAEYSKSGHIGFRAYVAAITPGAKVSGTTAEGLTLRFEDESVYTMFALRWL